MVTGAENSVHGLSFCPASTEKFGPIPAHMRAHLENEIEGF